MKNKSNGIIFFTKKIKDNDLYIRLLSSNDEVISGVVFGGNSSKKKLIYQKGYFINYSHEKKHPNSPLIFTGEIIQPFIGNIFNDKYKLNAILSILGLINLSIVEGQKIKGIYTDVLNLIENIIFQNHWIIFYCEWLFILLQKIGYQIDYKKNYTKKYYDILMQDFSNQLNKNSIVFPHKLFYQNKHINYDNISSVFLIFENIFLKNHLDNFNYKMPISFINFKQTILNRLKNNNDTNIK